MPHHILEYNPTVASAAPTDAKSHYETRRSSQRAWATDTFRCCSRPAAAGATKLWSTPVDYCMIPTSLPSATLTTLGVPQIILQTPIVKNIDIPSRYSESIFHSLTNRPCNNFSWPLRSEAARHLLFFCLGLGVNQCYFPYAGHESAHYGTDSSGNPLLDRKTFPFDDIVHCMMIVLMERIPVAWWATWVTGEGGLIDTAYSVRNVHYAPSDRKELVPQLKRVLI
jgi:hypothetical protein